MGRYAIAFGGVQADTVAGGVPAGARVAGVPTGARPAVSYAPAPGEKPKCVGKIKTTGAACPNVATSGPHCAGHARQAEKQRKDQ
jgi:hypothetical protein